VSPRLRRRIMISRSACAAWSSLALVLGLSVAAAGCRDSQAASLHEDTTAPPPASAEAKVEAPAPAAKADAPAPAEAAPPGNTLTLSAVGDCTLGSDYRITGAEGSFHLAMDAASNDFSV